MLPLVLTITVALMPGISCLPFMSQCRMIHPLSPFLFLFPTGMCAPQIKSQQSEVTRILDGKNVKYVLVDISQDNALREEMRTKSGNPKAIPPQIFNGDHYCGVSGLWHGVLTGAVFYITVWETFPWDRSSNF